LEELTAELKAVESEIDDGRQEAKRLAALEAAAGMHRERGRQLLESKQACESELTRLNA
jgi:hypothetical protein